MPIKKSQRVDCQYISPIKLVFQLYPSKLFSLSLSLLSPLSSLLSLCISPKLSVSMSRHPKIEIRERNLGKK
ncbi:hypothetical protein L1887_09988 [Cichorium endivia]|nr:hypothetical protein L1887_09988 [Cichorium endivia]